MNLIILKLKALDILDLHPEEVARQLTLIEFDLFSKIELYVYFTHIHTFMLSERERERDENKESQF
jgi:hypothetical protein